MLPGRAARCGVTLIELLTVLAIVGVLAAIALPAVQAARSRSLDVACRDRLKQIGVALYGYHEAAGVFPPAKINSGSYAPTPGSRSAPVLGGGTKNTTGLSLLLPYMDQSALWSSCNFSLCSSANAAASGALMPVAGSDSANSTFVGVRLAAYLCPADRDAAAFTRSPDVPGDSSSANNARPSNYRFVTGGFDDSAPPWPLTTKDKWQGAFGNNGAAKIDEILDGASHTLAVGESLHSGGASAFGPWWGAGLPGCCHGTGKSKDYSSNHTGGWNFLLADGSVSSIAADVDAGLLERAAAIHDGAGL